MKKKLALFIVIIFLFTFIQPHIFAFNKNQVAEISKIENQLFGFDYSGDDINNRIIRLEENIYGKVSNGNINGRLDRISKDILSEQIGSEIKPTEDTFSDENTIADNNVNYPVVDEIEMKVFNKTFRERDFHSRIVSIERELFGKIYDIDDYSTRMDRIKAEVLPEKLAREKVFGYDNSDSLNSMDLSGLMNNRFGGRMPFGQEGYTRPYANYGDMTGGATALPDNLDDELAQLEYRTFGTEFSNDDTNTRIKRLNSATKAKQSSSRYDSNKFQQRMSTFMEIGAMLLMILAMVL